MQFALRSVAFILLFSCSLAAQSGPLYDIETMVGSDPIRDGGPASNAVFALPRCVTPAADGSVYICDGNNLRIRRVGLDGVITSVAGNGVPGLFTGGPLNVGDGGPAIMAMIQPNDVAVDRLGNLYISQGRDDRIRRVRTDGRIETFAGIGSAGYSGDGGLARNAEFSNPWGLALDSTGNLFIADSGNNVIRVVSPTGRISTIAGTGAAGFGGDGGPARSAQFNQPVDLAIGPDGSWYVADRLNHVIRRVAPSGVITTVVGVPSVDGGFSGDGGPATAAQLTAPTSVDVDDQGRLVIADAGNLRVRLVDEAGVITTIAGNGTSGFSGDGGPGDQALLGAASHVAFDADGGVLIADAANHLIRRVDGAGLISTLWGVGHQGEGGGFGPNALLYFPSGVAAKKDGDYVISDTFNHIIYRVNQGQGIERIAGTGERGLAADGAVALESPLAHPRDVAVDEQGFVYVAEEVGDRISRITPAGLIEALTGTDINTAEQEFIRALDGVAVSPTSVSVGPDGSVYFAERATHRVRRIRADVILESVAGSWGIRGADGDGGSAVRALLNGPRGVAASPDGNVYIADTLNHRIRKIDPQGTITTIAGTGQPGFSGDGGPATQAQLLEPYRVAADPEGYVYFTDSFNHAVRMITPEGTIFTIGGQGGQGGFAGDGGPARQAKLLLPKGLDVGPDGTVYVGDNDNHRSRALRPRPLIAPQAVRNAASFSATAIAPGSIVSVFGTNLAGWATSATTVPLPTELAGAQVTVEDVNFRIHQAQLFFGVRGQLNVLIPEEAEPGQARLKAIRGPGRDSVSGFVLSPVAPGVFTAASSGEGPASALWQRVAADGSQVLGLTFERDGEGNIAAAPIGFGAESDQVFLTLFATGLRGRSSLEAVTLTIGDIPVPITFAGAQAEFAGLDQVNTGPLPRVLANSGFRDCVLTVDGVEANVFTLRF